MVSKHSKKNKKATASQIEPIEPIEPSSPVEPIEPAGATEPARADDSIDPLVAALLSAASEKRVEPTGPAESGGQDDLDSIIASLLGSPSATPGDSAAPSDEPDLLPDLLPDVPSVLSGDPPDDEPDDEPDDVPDDPDAPFVSGDLSMLTSEFFEDTPEGFSDGSTAIPSDSPLIIELPRKRPIWPLIICASVVLIILTGGLTYYNKTTLAAQAVKIAEIQKQGDVLLDESIALIQEADSVIIAIDKAMEEQVAEEDVPKLEALIDQLESTQRSLDTAIEKAEEAQGVYIDDGRRELAQHARDAAEHRKKMLDLSSELVGYDIKAVKSAILLDEAWTLIVEADADMRSAVEVVAVGAGSAVTESRDYNQKAVEKLGQAQEKLVSATETFPALDLKVLADYLEVKKASAELALASDQAYLDGRYEDANSLNDEFYDKDAEAVELAAHIPTNPLSLLVSAYDGTVKQLREDYTKLRSEAADADAFLREYLGVDIQVGVESP